MISITASYIVRMLLKNKVVEYTEADVYQYGFEIFISSIITFFIAIIAGIVLHCFTAAMLYFLMFAVLRQICGGYHAKKYWSCNLIFAIVTTIVLLMFRFPSITDFGVAHYIFLVMSILIIFVYAPEENENKPLSAHQKKLFCIISRIVVALLAGISCMIYILQNSYAKLIDCTLLAIAISVLAVEITRGGESNEKDCLEDCCQDRCEEC